MTQPIEDAISAIGTKVGAVTGIEQSFINPPETVNIQTFVLIYAESGSVGIATMGEAALASIGNRAAFHKIAIDVLTRRTDISQNISFMKPFVDTIPAAILEEVSPTGDLFSGKVTTFGRIDYEWVNPKLAGVQYTGYHFIINDVKILINSS